MLASELEQLGLGEREAGVYAVLLEFGEASASELIRRLSWHRQLVYTALERLERDGLISTVRRGERRRWRAGKPEQLVARVRDRLVQAETLLPRLTALRAGSGIEQTVEIHPGLDGIKFVREDMLRMAAVRQPLLAFGAAGAEYQRAVGDYHLDWTQRRIAKRISYRLLSSPKQRAVLEKLYTPFHAFTEIRYLPAGFETPTTTGIYGNKIAIQLWGPPEPAAIMIENAALARNYRDYFTYLWKQARP